MGKHGRCIVSDVIRGKTWVVGEYDMPSSLHLRSRHGRGNNKAIVGYSPRSYEYLDTLLRE